MAIKIEMLRCFAAVAQSGNLADAADKLGRTPSAVSMMLKQFEDHLGTPLFESERKSRLTALGEFTLDEAVRELDHFERTISNIEAFAGSKDGFIRVAVVPSVAAVILPAALQRFHQSRPGVRIDVRDMDSASVLRELEKERVDIGIASGEAATAGIERETLFSDAFGVVCRADHPLASAKRPVDWSQLVGLPFITNGICALIKDEKFKSVVEQSGLFVRNTTSLFAMIRAGVGITVLPRLAVAGEQKDLLFLPVADTSARRIMELLCRAHVSLPPVCAEFQQCIREVTGEVAVG